VSCSVKTHFRSRVCLRVSKPVVNIGSRKCFREFDHIQGSKVRVVGVLSVASLRDISCREGGKVVAGSHDTRFVYSIVNNYFGGGTTKV